MWELPTRRSLLQENQGVDEEAAGGGKALDRKLGLAVLTWYGVGTIVGGGFYALVGKVAGEAGLLAPVSFVLAAAVAALSAFSFGELSSRYPFSAGESYYVREGFGLRWLSTLTGWLVVATGVVSAATLARAFGGFARELFSVSEAWVIVAVVAGLALVAAVGIGESAAVVAVITAIEVGGLLWVLAASGEALTEVPQRTAALVPSLSLADFSSIVSGAYLCFYSFVGFEDMVNLAEEVRRPKRNLPRAILMALGISTLLYVLVTLVAVLRVPPDELAASDAPLSLLLGRESYRSAMTVIAMLAGVNGALVQIVMAARIVYGMARRGQGPSLFGEVHPRTRTPLAATFSGSTLVLILALWFPLTGLAQATSTVLLAVFALVNLALWRIKGRESAPTDAVCYPRAIPLAGFAVCTAFLAFRILTG